MSGSTDLFPQHCIAPEFTPDTHVQELVNEFKTSLAAMRRKRRTTNVLQTLAKHMDAYVSSEPLPLPEHQGEQRVDKQRVLNIPTPPVSPEIQRVGVAHCTPLANNPTLTRVLQSVARTHHRSTCANTPGALLPIRQVNIIEPPEITQAPPIVPSAKHSRILKAKALNQPTAPRTQTQQRSSRLAPPRLRLRKNHLVSKATINLLLLDDITNDLTEYTPLKLPPMAPSPINCKHYAIPMVHPITGESITNYRRPMKDPITAETWMTAFGKDFGGMCQGDTKRV